MYEFQLPYPCGDGVIELIHDIMNGYDANNLPANLYVETYCITKDNVDEVCPEGQTYASPLKEFEVMTVDEYNAAHAEESES